MQLSRGLSTSIRILKPLQEGTRKGHRMEQEALSRCRLAIYSSEWAAQTAIDYYDVDAGQSRSCFRPNIECNRNHEDIKEIIAQGSHCLQVAVCWG